MHVDGKSEVGGDSVAVWQHSDRDHDDHDSVLPAQLIHVALLCAALSLSLYSEGFSNLQIRQRNMSAII